MALAAAVLVVSAAAIGQGVAVLAGAREWVWWAPGAGLCVMVSVAGLLIHAPGDAATVAATLAVLTVAALGFRVVRTALVAALPDAVPAALITLAAVLLPFAVSGRTGILGVGQNNDMSAHLTTAWWLQHRLGSPGIGAVGGALPDVGYPLGPHALAAALSLGHISLVHAFNAVIVVAAPLTALVALGALKEVRRPARIAAAALVGLCYLAVSYLVQAAFKETLEALILITAVLIARDVAGGRLAGWRAGLALGVVAGGAIHVYSYPGLAWPIMAVGGITLASRAWRLMLRAAPGVLLPAALLIAPAAGRILDFYNSPFAGENHNGNLVNAVRPLEALGVWLNADFRFDPHPLWPTVVLGALAAVALAAAIWRLVSRREPVLAVALATSVVLYVYAAATKSIYVSAKTLAVLAPLAALTMAAGLLGARSGALLRGLALVIGLAAAASSFLALRDARVGPVTHEQELASLRPKLGHHSTLFMGNDDFTQWDLHGANVAIAHVLYAPGRAYTRPSKQLGEFETLDFDNFLPQTLDRFRYVIGSNTPYASVPPPNFRLIASTRSFQLWRRSGRTPLRWPVDPDGAPGGVLNCRSSVGRLRLGGAGPRGTAGVLPRPVAISQADWRGQPRRAGDSAAATVRLPRGTWDLSMQYVSTTGLDIRAGALRGSLPASLDRLGPYFRVGTVRVRRAGPLVVTVTARPMNALGRLLGAPGATRALNSPHNLPLDGLAFTRHGARERVVPAQRACGHYVDWVAPAAAGS
jgi:hypothetical protein